MSVCVRTVQGPCHFYLSCVRICTGSQPLPVVLFAAKEPLEGVHEAPTDETQMRENVESVLRFMVTRRIRMHQINAQGESA